MNEDDLLNGEEMPDLTQYGDDGKPVADAKPEYVTRADLESFGEAMAAKLAALMKPSEAAKAETPPDWEDAIKKGAVDAATIRMMELQKPTFSRQIVSEVAGELPKNVKDEILAELMKLPAQTVAMITQNPDDLKKIARMAKGMDVEMNPDRVKAPRSSASGTVGGQSSSDSAEVAKLMAQYRGVPGFTEKEAMEIVKDRK